MTMPESFFYYLQFPFIAAIFVWLPEEDVVQCCRRLFSKFQDLNMKNHQLHGRWQRSDIKSFNEY